VPVHTHVGENAKEKTGGVGRPFVKIKDPSIRGQKTEDEISGTALPSIPFYVRPKLWGFVAGRKKEKAKAGSTG